MINNILVTIGIPVYNVSQYIEKALLSALDQTFNKKMEILIVDDKGNDNSMDIVRHLSLTHSRGECIRIIEHPQNKGVAETRNTIVKEALGEYLIFLDSDDEISLNAVQILYNKMIERPVDFVIASYERCERNGTILFEKKYEDTLIEGEYELAYQYFIKKKYLEIVHIPVWNKLYNIDFLKKNKIKCSPGYMYEDSFFTFQVILNAVSCRFVPDVLYYYYCNPSSITAKSDFWGMSNFQVQSCLNLIKCEKFYCSNYIKLPIFEYAISALLTDSVYLASFMYSKKLENKLTANEIKQMLFCFPLTLKRLLYFKEKRIHCFILWLISKSPYFMQLFLVKIRAKKMS